MVGCLSRESNHVSLVFVRLGPALCSFVMKMYTRGNHSREKPAVSSVPIIIKVPRWFPDSEQIENRHSRSPFDRFSSIDTFLSRSVLQANKVTCPDV